MLVICYNYDFLGNERETLFYLFHNTDDSELVQSLLDSLPRYSNQGIFSIRFEKDTAHETNFSYFNMTCTGGND